MSIYVIVCPYCKQADSFERDIEFEYNSTFFKCECGNEFTLEEAETMELERK
ncbi:MAG: hypothetical protein ACLUG9_16545 [Paraclostridium sordellii]